MSDWRRSIVAAAYHRHKTEACQPRAVCTSTVVCSRHLLSLVCICRVLTLIFLALVFIVEVSSTDWCVADKLHNWQNSSLCNNFSSSQCCKGCTSSQWERVKLPLTEHTPINWQSPNIAHVIMSTISAYRPHLVKIAQGVTSLRIAKVTTHFFLSFCLYAQSLDQPRA